jgi:phosphate transport system permease protein
VANLSGDELLDHVYTDVVGLDIFGTWTLAETLFQRALVEEEFAALVDKLDPPNPELKLFHSWLSKEFVTQPQSSFPELAGVRSAIIGTLLIMALTMTIAFPLGVGAAIYLEEYAHNGSALDKTIETNIRNLAGVPSIIYGLLGLAIFVRTLGSLTSGAFVGITDSNGRTILSASLTMALLILPVIIIAAQEAIRAVPQSIREASYGLGATKWQTIWRQILPAAMPGILTGTILSLSRAIGETAPLIVIGASAVIFVDPSGPFSKFTALPIQIWQWTARPQDEFRNLAAAAIIVLLVLLIGMNSVAIILRQRLSKRY